MTTRIRLSVLALSLVLLAAGSLRAQAPADSGVFIIRHAGDTVAVERFSRTPVRLAGTLDIHNSRRSSQDYTAVIAPDATLPLIELTLREGIDTAGTRARVVQRARVIFKDDSVAVDEVGGAGLMTRVFSTEKGAVPYLNLSFALLEQATRLASRGRNDIAFFNLGGGQTRTAKLSRLGSDSVSLALGEVEYHLRVDGTGRLLGARIPAQNVTVERQ
jgi:hypothetical protein